MNINWNYPFGLQHDNSWSRAGRENKYRFNAASELNEETQNYEMYFRAYDPVIGRMMGVDPYAESFRSWTPYQYAMNDPMYWNDPSGGITITFSAAQWDAIELGLNSDNGGEWSSGGVFSFFGSQEAGFLAGAYYNYDNNSWGNTEHGGWNGSVDDFNNRTGRNSFAHEQTVQTQGTPCGCNGQPNQNGPNPLEVGPDPNSDNFFSFFPGGDNFSNTDMGRDLAEIDMSSTGNLYLSGTGLSVGARELSQVQNGMWKGANGKWYSLKWGGNAAAGSRNAVTASTSVLKGISRGLFFVGGLISIGEIIQNPTKEQGVKSGADIGMGGLGAFGGPFGLFVSGMHFADQLLQNTVPGYTEFMTAGGGIGGPTYTGSDGVYVCFVEGTVIHTSDGLVKIEDLEEGMQVFSYNFDSDSLELQPITTFFTRNVEEVYEIQVGNELIKVTAEHPFYVQGKEWVKVKDLQKGNLLINADGDTAPILSIRKSDIAVTVYNIEVDKNHNYYVTAAKFLVHNKNIAEQSLLEGNMQQKEVSPQTTQNE